MKAPHTDQLELLRLQKLDQKESSLRHKRESHPAHETVREFAARVADLQRAAITHSALIADTQREITRIEDEIAKVNERRARQQGRIDNGQVPLRDISAMEHEIAQMGRRLSTLEDDQIEVEDRLEASQKAHDEMKNEAAAIAADIERIKADFQAEIADADNELRATIKERRELAQRLNAELLEEYEEARRRNGALAVVEVRDGIAIGVGADISPLELERIRLAPVDELYLTEDNGQIVVRTSASTPR